MDISTPKIFMFTEFCDVLGYGVDFEYRYKNGITVCIEEVMAEETLRRENIQ